LVVYYSLRGKQEKAKKVVGTVDRVHKLNLCAHGLGTDVEIATSLAFREILLADNSSDVIQFLVVGLLYTKCTPKTLRRSRLTGGAAFGHPTTGSRAMLFC
jgi:hypothetical protein